LWEEYTAKTTTDLHNGVRKDIPECNSNVVFINDYAIAPSAKGQRVEDQENSCLFFSGACDGFVFATVSRKD
jgi:hypothetical protein